MTSISSRIMRIRLIIDSSFLYINQITVKKYQFKRIIVPEYRVEKTLNEYGSYGFRVIHCKGDGDRYIILLEREYVENDTSDTVGTVE